MCPGGKYRALPRFRQASLGVQGILDLTNLPAFVHAAHSAHLIPVSLLTSCAARVHFANYCSAYCFILRFEINGILAKWVLLGPFLNGRREPFSVWQITWVGHGAQPGHLFIWIPWQHGKGTIAYGWEIWSSNRLKHLCLAPSFESLSKKGGWAAFLYTS